MVRRTSYMPSILGTFSHSVLPAHPALFRKLHQLADLLQRDNLDDHEFLI